MNNIVDAFEQGVADSHDVANIAKNLAIIANIAWYMRTLDYKLK